MTMLSIGTGFGGVDPDKFLILSASRTVLQARSLEETRLLQSDLPSIIRCDIPNGEMSDCVFAVLAKSLRLPLRLDPETAYAGFD